MTMPPALTAKASTSWRENEIETQMGESAWFRPVRDLLQVGTQARGSLKSGPDPGPITWPKIFGSSLFCVPLVHNWERAVDWRARISTSVWCKQAGCWDITSRQHSSLWFDRSSGRLLPAVAQALDS